MELDAIPSETLEQIEGIGSTDVVVGVLCSDPEGAANGAARLVSEAVGRLPGGPRAVVIHNNGNSGSASQSSSGSVEEDGVRVLPCKMFEPEPSGAPQKNLTAAYSVIFKAGDRLSARACGVIASDLGPSRRNGSLGW